MKMREQLVDVVGMFCVLAPTATRGPRSGHRERVKGEWLVAGHRNRFLLLVLVFLAGCLGGVRESLGQPLPDLTVSQTQGVNESDYFFLGPTGMRGWMWWSSQTREARQILVTEVPAGSPADGIMEYHDVILGIGEDGAFDYDARVAFVDALIEAEGTDGKLELNVYRPSTGVTEVKTIQLGITNAPLAATTPYHCVKAEAVLTNFCEYVYQNGTVGHPTLEFSVWAMLASDNPKYVNWAKNWVKDQNFSSRTNLSIFRPIATRNWDMSFRLATLAQYYLLTEAEGDPDYDVLPAMTNAAVFIAQGQDRRGQWGHTYAYPQNNGGQLHGTLPGYGAVNAAGLVSLYALALSRNAGVDHPAVDAAIEKSAAFFRANVGIGTVNYGFHDPIPGVVDVNGRMGVAALAFRALGDVEAAKWFAMMTSTYGWRNWGHTGNEFNHAWGPLAANVGGPELVKFVHTNRNYNVEFDVDQPYHQVTLHMLRQPSGRFQSQGQEGRGPGRSNGHATGSYALQMAIPNATIDVTGAGYGEEFWLTPEEMEQVRIGFKYESGGVTVDHLSNEELLEYIGNFSPRVVRKMADELRNRLGESVGGETISDILIAIVEDEGEPDNKRVAALRALDSSGREAVKAETDTWYHPDSGYILNYGARNNGFRDHDSRIKMLEAIAQFDPTVPFDMLVVGNYSSTLGSISTNGFTPEEMEIYYDAVAVILSPDAGNVGSFVRNQNIHTWSPSLLARYGDSILRVSEMFAPAYNAGRVLATPPIGEGMYAWTVRSRHEGFDTSDHWHRYGMHFMRYTNYFARLKAQMVNSDYHRVDEFLEFHLPEHDRELYWFRDLIADNIASDHPGADATQLRALLEASADTQDLYRVVLLDKLVQAIGDTTAFDDIVKYVGYRSPIDGTNWRQFRGAIEIATDPQYSTNQQWIDALPVAVANDDQVQIGGILHVLAAREVPGARDLAEPLLLSDNDFVTIAALDVYGVMGVADDLPMLFNQFMTNVSSEVDGEVLFADDFKIHAYWDAMHAIVERHAPIDSSIANQMAADFNTVTSNATRTASIANITTPRPEPMSVLNPAESNVDKVYGVHHVTGPIGILGLFPGTDCDAALQTAYATISDSQWSGRGQKYAASEVFMRRYGHEEVIRRQRENVSSPWNDRIATMYLLMELLEGRVPIEHQLDLLTLNHLGTPLQSGGSGESFPRSTAQIELNRRRGLEEQGAVYYFFMK